MDTVSINQAPRRQPLLSFNGGKWVEITTVLIPREATNDPFSFNLLTWNIDFQVPNGPQRTTQAIWYLYSRLKDSNLPSIIQLQEMERPDLEVISRHEWIQSNFNITDVSPQHWLSSYGTVTLIDRRLVVGSVFRVPYFSRMGRDGLFVDIQILGSTTEPLRICNAHLESLVANPPLRPAQVTLATKLLHETGAGIMAGDFNAIEPFDLDLHTQNNMNDAYLALGGEEGAAEGWTWGMQTFNNPFPYSRMDKIWYCGRLTVKSLDKFGEGLKVGIESIPEEQYVTDHLGLQAVFEVNV